MVRGAAFSEWRRRLDTVATVKWRMIFFLRCWRGGGGGGYLVATVLGCVILSTRMMKNYYIL